MTPPTATPIVVRDDRIVVEVGGADRDTFLEATLSQQVTGVADARVLGALWLDVHGATQAAVEVVVDDARDRFLLLVPEAHRGAVLEGLAMRTFLADARFEALDHVVVAVRDADVDVPPAATTRRDGDVLVVPRVGGVDLVATSDDATAWLDAHGLPTATDDPTPLRDHEVVHGVPRAPDEIAGPHLPEELGLLPTHVHLAKGCYPGQEAVARMWMLGRPRRRLTVLELDEGRPAPGDEVGDGRARWTVTRVTSPASPSARALAFGPGTVAVDDVVEGPGWRARVAAVVGADVAQPGADPGVTRRRDRAAGDRGPTASRDVRPGARRAP